jgi:hypothetical protein
MPPALSDFSDLLEVDELAGWPRRHRVYTTWFQHGDVVCWEEVCHEVTSNEATIG